MTTYRSALDEETTATTYIFTAKIEVTEQEAIRLKKVLEDAYVIGTGNWGYEKKET